jgi:F-type H+/Na+-transporting ATPase subunit alpha
MTELTIRPDEIRDALQKFVADYQPSAASVEEVGRVSDAGDGIAHVEGLPSAMANELLEFADGTLGLALNLDTRDIGVVILGDFSGIEEGQTVRRTGEVLSVPVGDGYLGRVVDPLGNPIDGLGEITPLDGRRALELQAPTVVQRKSVHEPLLTGLKAIDSLTPIGRGQRQLIIGDRQTGKTAIAIDTIINQKDYWASGDDTSASARRARRSPPSAERSKRPARWSTRRSSPLLPPTRLASSSLPRTPAQPSASTGCTRASTS